VDEAELQERWQEFAEGLGVERLDQLSEYMTQLVIEAVQDIEFLTIVEVGEAEGWDLSEQEQEFMHGLITSSYISTFLREALL